MRIQNFLLAGVCFAVPVAAQGAFAPDAPEHGGIAPADTWYTEGGCAARTGVSLTQPVARHPDLAWTFQSDHPLVGEPLVWGDLVVLEEDGGPKQRTLRVLRLRDGKPHTKAVRLKCGGPLRPCLWQDRIAIRFGPDKVRVLQIGPKRTHKLYEVRFRDTTVLGSLMLGDELYVLTEGSLERYSIQKKKRLWRVEAGFVGLPSAFGEHVCAILTSPSVAVLQVRRSDGKVDSMRRMSNTDEYDQVDPQHVRVILGATHFMAYRCPAPAGTIGRQRKWQKKNVELFKRRLPNRVGSLTSYAVTAPPCLCGASFYGLFTNSGTKRTGEWVKGSVDELELGKPTLSSLARQDRDSGLLGFTGSVTVAGDVGFLGSVAFNVDSQDILWRQPAGRGEPVLRAVPARNTLLVRHGPCNLIAYGRRALLDVVFRAADKPVSRAEPAADVAAPQAVGVLRSGKVLTGNVMLGKAEVAFGKGSKRRTWPLQELQLLVGPKMDFLFWAGSPRQLEVAFARLVDHKMTRAYVGLVRKAAESNDGELMTRIRNIAVARGVKDREVQVVQKRLALMKVRDLRRVPNKVRAVLDQEARLRESTIAGLWKPLAAWCAQLPREHRSALYNSVLTQAPSLYGKVWPEVQALHANASPPQQAAAVANVAAVVPRHALELWKLFTEKLAAASPETKARMARAVLREHQNHAAATSLVRQLVPPSLDISGEFVALEWLDLVQVLHKLKVKKVEQPPKGKFVLPYDQRQLVQYQRKWRKDLVAFRSKNMLVLSPCNNPKGMAQCLSLGELVCSTLGEIFAAGDKKRAKDLPMRLVLYETKEEYRKHSLKGKWKSHLKWSAGHYNGDESRMYLPKGEGAFEQVMEVFAHELAHHWIDSRCPMFTSDERTKAYGKQVPAEWIVEGFASMVEGFEFDLVNRTYRPSHPRMRRLDIVANAGRSRLESWRDVLTSTYEQKHRRFSATKNRVRVQTRWDLGVSPMPSSMSLFYAQSTAVCHYLFMGEGGNYRKRLLDYLTAHYTGQIDKLDIEKAFGMSELKLGRRAVEHARLVVSRAQ